MSSSSSKTLVIVESPAKAKTINKFLGHDYRVVASVGHVIDLPPKDLGVDVDKGFKPSYHIIKGKQDVLKRLKAEAAKTDRILLAMDPDREGEAIAWLIAERLKKDNPDIQRIEFNEITSTAIQAAVQQPRAINRDRVESQQARRVLDRLVGYMVSPVLWQGIVKGLSAGRVQSVALRLICEREAEIESFVPVEYWKISAKLQTPKGEEFIAKLVKIGKHTLNPQKYRISTRGDADTHVAAIRKETFVVSKITREKVNKKPPPPFITSTLQQDAARRFRMPTKQDMSVAQKLYEGIDLGAKGTLGLITYMRSDSTRISDEAMKAVRSYIAGSFGVDYLPEKPVSYQSKKGAQDAHEAIRPTQISADFEPRHLKKFLSKDEFRIYELIWKRFVACQMKPAVIARVTVDITAGDYLFRTQGETILFRGFLQAYQLPGDDAEVTEEDEDEGTPNVPADIAQGQRLTLLDLLLKQLFTKPPPRYTESSLVKTLDKLGIGRPSTYSQIIATLFYREYATVEAKKWLLPTELGRTVNYFLVQHFEKLFNVAFTADMEASLDRIEASEASYLKTLKTFYEPFRENLDNVTAAIQQIKIAARGEDVRVCKTCSGSMTLRWGQDGHFLACENYPECKSTRSLPKAKTDSKKRSCKACGSTLIVRDGRFGSFLSCSRYPDCKYTRPLGIGVDCTQKECDGELLQRQSRKGTIFFGCSNYPNCSVVYWNRPIARSCRTCSFPLVEEVEDKHAKKVLKCPNCSTVQES